ncbi:MAG: aminotransferase class IV [Candidatus Omnitrophota bacterium]
MKRYQIIYVDGKYIKADAQMLEAFTPGVFRAKGVFETMLAVGGKVFDVDLHLRRLHRAFKGVIVKSSVVKKIVEINRFDLSRVRVLAWQEGKKKHTAVMALKYSLPKKKVFKVCLVKTLRQANNRWANTKSLDYKIFADAYHKARAKGFDEALLINREGFVFEASRANIFIFSEGKLITPPLSSGCLNGVTRQRVVQVAKQLKVPVVEQDLIVSMIESATAAFLTNSLLGIKFFRLASRK